eukprot:79087-Pelagomonas_calceolata.AAC.1
MAEFAINNPCHESTKTTPFGLNYGRDPQTPLSWTIKASSKVPVVETFITNMQQGLKDAKEALQAAQQRQEAFADKKRRHVEFSVGDEVLLSSKNIKLRLPGTPKLMPKWIGHLQVVEKESMMWHADLSCPPISTNVMLFHVYFLRSTTEMGVPNHLLYLP